MSLIVYKSYLFLKISRRNNYNGSKWNEIMTEIDATRRGISSLLFYHREMCTSQEIGESLPEIVMLDSTSKSWV